MVGTGRQDLPQALARVRVQARQTIAIARLPGEIATGTLRWQAALDRIVSEATGRPLARLDPEVLDDPSPDAVPAASPRSRPGVRGRQRCCEPDQTRRQAQRGAARERRAPAGEPRAGRSCRFQSRPSDTTDSAAVRAYLVGDVVAASLAGGPVGCPLRLRGGRILGRFNNAPAPLTLRVNRSADDQGSCDRRAGAGRRARRAGPLRARTRWSCSTEIPC